MENLIFLTLISITTCLFVGYGFYRQRKYKPRNTLVDLGEMVCINRPIMESLEVSKISIVKIQIAGNCVTLFNRSDNAIDVNVSKKEWAEEVFEQAKSIFAHAEVVEIDC